MSEYHVQIPEESHTVVEFNQNGVPGIGVVNDALVEFEPKVVFAWHCSIMIEILECGDNKMPTPAEQEILYEFEDALEPAVMANGNALFLARVTNDGWRELVYRVYDPEPLNDHLQELIRTQQNIRPFDYRIDGDETWDKASWFLNAVS